MAKERSKRIALPAHDLLCETFLYCRRSGLLFRRGEENRPLGTVGQNGYMYLRFKGVLYTMHRLIWKMSHNSEPQHIDHINGIRTDNRLSNLREASRSENNRNIGLSPKNTSGYTGVVFIKRYNRWMASLKVNRKQVSAGYHKEKLDAVLAFNELAMKWHGEFAKRRIEHNIQMLIQEYGVDYERKRTLQAAQKAP